jgi:hypothetical protein
MQAFSPRAVLLGGGVQVRPLDGSRRLGPPAAVSGHEPSLQLQLAFQNIAGLTSKSDEAVTFMSRSGSLIYGLCETKLRESFLPSGIESLSHRWIGTAPSPANKSASGGLGFLIHESIASLTHEIASTSDQLWIHLRDNHAQVAICLVYRNPSMNAADTADFFSRLHDSTQKERLRCDAVVIGGDFNARSGRTKDKTVTSAGRAFLDFTEANDLELLNVSTEEAMDFTRVGSNQGVPVYSTLDYIVATQGFASYFKVHRDGPDSDHRPISAKIPWSGRGAASPPRQVSQQWRWDLENLDREQFQNALEHSIPKSPDHPSVPSETSELLRYTKDKLMATAKRVVSKKFLKPTAAAVPIISAFHPLAVDRRLARMRYEKALDDHEPDEVTEGLCEALREARRRFRNEVARRKQAGRMRLASKLCHFSADPSRFWSTWRAHVSHGASAGLSVLKGGSELLIRGDDAIASEAARQIEALQFPVPVTAAVTAERVRRLSTVQTEHPILDRPISSDEIAQAVTKLKPRKATGLDSLPAEFMVATSNFLGLLARLFSLILSTSQWPSEWSEGVITLIHKSGPKELLANYRQITVLPSMAKLFEMVLYRRLESWLEGRGLLREEQGGFRPDRRCQDQSLVLHETLYVRRERKESTFVAFIDVKAAYDAVSRDHLWLAVWQLGIFGRCWTLLRAMYDNVKRYVRVGSCLSPAFTVTRGVAQGSVLSPILYAIFSNGLLSGLASQPEQVLMGRRAISSLAYADDLAPIAAGPGGLQSKLDCISAHAAEMGYEHNNKKSAVMVMGSPLRWSSDTWSLGGRPLPLVTLYKYLGLEEQSSGSWCSVIDRLLAKAKGVAAKLRGAGCVAAVMSPRHARLLFYALARPHLEFGCEIWTPSRHQEAQLERVQLLFARKALGLPSRCNSVCVLAEFGVLPSFARRDLLRLYYWHHLVETDAARLLCAVWRDSATRVDDGGSLDSILVGYRTILTRYGLETHWLERSVSPDWLSRVRRLVSARVLEDRRVASVTSTSVATYFHLAPSLGIPVWAGDTSNPLGLWVKRRLRTSCLPLLSTLGRWAKPVWHASLTTCLMCGSEPEDAAHFILRCASLAQIVEERDSQLELALSSSDDGRVALSFIRTSPPTLMMDVLLGFNPSKWPVDVIWSIHRVARNSLAAAWRRRSALCGGLPSLSPEGGRKILPPNKS